MSNYPNQLDDDVSLPRVDDDITQEGGAAINALRDAIFGIEGALGTGAPGGLLQGISLTQFLLQPQPYDAAGHAFNAPFFLSNGTINPSFFVTLPALTNIVDSQISATAGIQESKLALTYGTAALYNIMNNINTNVDVALNFIINHGSKIEPHLQGITFRHTMDQIDVSETSNNYFLNRLGLDRDNTNLYTLFNDVNNDLVAHEKANSTALGPTPTSTTVGTIPPTNYAHVSAGLYVNTTNFSFIPQTATSVQDVLQFIDNSNILILGTRIQTLYQNGISRSSRATVVTNNTTGQLIVPLTQVTTYHLDGGSSVPVDSISNGDDIVQFFPSLAVAATNVFDTQFSGVKVGDILTVNYGSNIAISSLIKEIKYSVGAGNPPSKTYMVRIDSKNLFESTTATATITRSLVNTDKYGVLAVSQAQSPVSINGALPSLVVSSPRGAEVLGIGFNPDLFDANHYKLYLVLYPNGNPASSTYNLFPIDVTGNQGKTPGQYTLDSIVAATNALFRSPGFNYRFVAYQNKGNFGIMLADSLGGASFSIIAGIIGTDGLYDQSLSNTVYPSNVVDNFTLKDALGFGILGANVASPPYQPAYANTQIAQTPTKIFVPLTRKTFYVNGVERERFNTEPFQLPDGYGDGYWPAFIVSKQVIGPRVKVTYQVNSDLSTSGLAVGKTLVVQPENGSGSPIDFGRFFIESIQLNNCDCDGYSAFTTISVYDGIHGTGITPYVSSPAGTLVRLYSSGDSVGFSAENASDSSAPAPTSLFKRHFEVYVNEDGYTFTHERGRMNISGAITTVNGTDLYSSSELSYINIQKISPKLRGYVFAGGVTKINLQVTSYVPATGVFSGYLCAWDGYSLTHQGSVVTGKSGQVARFYDETNIDYIDFIFSVTDSVPAISTTKTIDIQLFPTLSLDDQVMLLSTVQVNDSTKQLSYLKDARQFGNVSEKQLSDSALDFIQSAPRNLHQNGVVRGFDITDVVNNNIYLNGGLALVNGKFVAMNNALVVIPLVQELFSANQYNINWILCVNEKDEFVTIPLTDYDPILSTPNSPDRIVNIFNVVNSGTYNVDSTTFSNLLNFRKDLTPLYLLASTVTGAGPSTVGALVNYDLRKYVVDSNSSIRATLTDQETQGNFRSLVAALSWFKYNGNYQSTLYVKSANTIDFDPGLSQTQMYIIGDGSNAAITFTSSVAITNTHFEKMSLTFSQSWSSSNSSFNDCIIASAQNITLTNTVLENCTLSVTSGTITLDNCTLINCTVTVTSGAVTVQGTTFEKCTLVTADGAVSLQGTTFTGGTITTSTGVVTIQGVTIDGCALSLNSIVNTNSNCVINLCTIDASASNLSTVFNVNPSASNVKFNGCDVNYVPTVTGTSYSSANMINDGYGFIYSNVSLLQNIVVDGCKFTTNTSTRFPLIGFTYASNSAIAQGIHITNNKFYNTSSIDDKYAVIAFTCTLTTGVITSFPPSIQPTEGLKLIDCLIQNNFCDKNQMISITGSMNSVWTVACSIVPIATRIVGNSCGTISVIGAADLDRNYETSTNGIGYDKGYGVVIAENTCRYIGMLSATGQSTQQVAVYSPVDYSPVTCNTCSMMVRNNVCSWIEITPNAIQTTTTTVPYQTNCAVIITDNSLRAYDPAYIIPFSQYLSPAHFLNTSIALSTGIANYVAYSYSPQDYAIIKGNTIIQGSALNSAGVTVVYDYTAGVAMGVSGLIDGNVFNSIATMPAAPTLGDFIFVYENALAFMNVSITNNQFYRNGNSIRSYINVQMPLHGVITGNFFDQSTTNGTNEVLIFASPITDLNNLTISHNKNQVGYAYVNPNQLGFYSWNDSGLWNFNDTGAQNSGLDLDILNGSFSIYGEMQIDTIVPKGTQLLYMVAGIGLLSGTGTVNASNSNFYFGVQIKKSSAFTIGSFSGSIADVIGSPSDATTFHQSNTQSLNSGNASAFHSATQYLTLDLSTFNMFNNGAQAFNMYVFASLISASGQNLEVNYSPILVKYKW